MDLVKLCALHHAYARVSRKKHDPRDLDVDEHRTMFYAAVCSGNFKSGLNPHTVSARYFETVFSHGEWSALASAREVPFGISLQSTLYVQ